MNADTDKTYKGKCVDCGSPLELYEIDFDKNRRIMQCTRCGLYHFYKKDFFGKWKLVKAGRVSDLWRKPQK
jgi:DNA-directed RNA polymerase subunit RPC12/RpoP